MNFFITGLPRSRTAWLANYFSTGDVFCWHEAMAGITCKQDYWARLATTHYKHVGNSDCTLFMGGYIHGAPLVIIDPITVPITPPTRDPITAPTTGLGIAICPTTAPKSLP